MLASADFGPLIDPARIAGMGHSHGGYSIQGVAGGWASWTDPRIRAALLFAPYSEPFMVQESWRICTRRHVSMRHAGPTHL